MKIAILLGVSNYQKLNDLLACKTDVHLIEQVLRSTGNYTEILSISDNCTAANIKSKISDFVSKVKENEVDEVFFYYTGHGDFYEQQFYYALTDFDANKRKQTSLENNEIDNWLRSLDPKLTIKVIDACHSGISYIKNESAITEHLEKSKQKFNDCYFMFSSNHNQASYQDKDLSFFTRSFLKSLIKENDQKIRYKDIIDFVSDEFDHSTNQTPIFITQGSFTEVFCISSPEVQSIVNPLLTIDEDEKTGDELAIESPETLSLIDLIQNDAKDCCDNQEVEDLLAKIKNSITEFSFSGDTGLFYELDKKFLTHNSYSEIPRLDAIGKWFEKNRIEYFVDIEKEEVSYETEVSDYSTFGLMRGGYRTKTKYRTEISGFRITANTSYDLIRIDAQPKYPNIPPFHCSFLIFLSKKSLIIFHFFTYFREKNWKDRELVSDFKWQFFEKKLKNETGVISTFSSTLKDFEDYVLQKLNERFNNPGTDA